MYSHLVESVFTCVCGVQSSHRVCVYVCVCVVYSHLVESVFTCVCGVQSSRRVCVDVCVWCTVIS